MRPSQTIRGCYLNVTLVEVEDSIPSSSQGWFPFCQGSRPCAAQKATDWGNEAPLTRSKTERKKQKIQKPTRRERRRNFLKGTWETICTHRGILRAHLADTSWEYKGCFRENIVLYIRTEYNPNANRIFCYYYIPSVGWILYMYELSQCDSKYLPVGVLWMRCRKLPVCDAMAPQSLVVPFQRELPAILNVYE